MSVPRPAPGAHSAAGVESLWVLRKRDGAKLAGTQYSRAALLARPSCLSASPGVRHLRMSGGEGEKTG